MKVYSKTDPTSKYTGERTPLCVETNLEFALPYWTARKKINRNLYWEIV